MQLQNIQSQKQSQGLKNALATLIYSDLTATKLDLKEESVSSRRKVTQKQPQAGSPIPKVLVGVFWELIWRVAD